MLIFFGYILISFVFGFLLAVSSTPVIGTFLSATLGLVATVVGTQYFAQNNRVAIERNVGQGLVIISIGLVLGMCAGHQVRILTLYQSSVRFNDLPWGRYSPPKATKEALDWLRIREKMINMGYSNQQVTEIYSIRLKEVERLQKVAEDNATKGRILVRRAVEEIYEPKILHSILSDESKVEPLHGFAMSSSIRDDEE